MSLHPNTLSLELSGFQGSIAMMNNSGEIKTTNIQGGDREKDNIFPAIEELSSFLEISPKEIELVVVSIGPGGFTGLRTAVAIAKMISLVSGASIVSVETAIVTVQQSNHKRGSFLVLSSVKGDQFWLSKIVKDNGHWTCNSKNSSTKTLESEMVDIHGVFVDDFLPDGARSIIERHEVSIYQRSPDANTLLHIGLHLYKAGRCTKPSELLPLYAREPEAVRLWQARKSSLVK